MAEQNPIEDTIFPHSLRDDIRGLEPQDAPEETPATSDTPADEE